MSPAILQTLDREPPNGSVLAFLASITPGVDDMGGTLGAIFGILLSAFVSALRALPAASKTSPSPALFAPALATAVSALKSHTSAREGDRTVMDVLLPFADSFAATLDFSQAVGVAKEKAEGTKYLRPRFGRATYVTAAAGQEVPDPGAWALYEMLDGMAKGLAAAQPQP
jgi:dihydroxyacetone kinase